MDKDSTESLCTALRFLVRSGLVDYNGHASVRVPNGFVINSGASNRAAPQSSEMTQMSLDGDVLSGPRPPNECHLHAAIYQARPDVRAIVHGHPKWICTLTTAGHGLAPVMPQGALVAGLPRYEHAHSISTAARGAAVADTLGQARGALLMGHGLVMTGSDIVAACVLALYAEQTAERQVCAAPIGGARLLPDDEIAEYRKTLDSPGLFAKCWEFYLTRQGD